MKTTEKPMSRKRLKELDDDDIPVVREKSIEELEKELGHGFWGNATTGYVNDKDNK